MKIATHPAGAASHAAAAARHNGATRRNSFKELFEGTGTVASPRPAAPASKPAASQARISFSPPGIALHAATHLAESSPALEHTRSNAAAEAAGPPNTTAGATNDATSANNAISAVPSVPGMDLSMYTPIANPVSLQPLRDALQRAGLSPDFFQFHELQSFEAFPTRADLSYTNRQILIQGPYGAGLFDLYWALRTPWVTATEMRTYGIA